MKILVVGGAGYIGSHTVKKIVENNEEVTVFDNFENGNEFVMKTLGVSNYINGDLRVKSDLNKLYKHQFDACIHLAAFANVGESMNNPYKYFENNVIGTLNLLDYLSSTNCKKLIFSSTSEVYGESQYLPIDENHVKNPVNPYGYSKLISENLIKSYSKTHGIKYLIFRYFNAAGCSMDGKIGELHHPECHLIPNIIYSVLGLKEFKLTCSMVDTKDKTPIRDYVHVDDIADAHFSAIDYLDINDSDEINLGSGKGYSVLEIVEQVERITGFKVEKNIGETRLGEPAAKYASNEKAKLILGWTPKNNLEDIIKSTYDFMKGNTNLLLI